MELKELTCLKCGASINHISLQESLVNCQHCGSSFLLYNDIAKENRTLYPIPNNITISTGAGYFALSYKWPVVKYAVLLGFATFWILFASFWTYLASEAGGLFAMFGITFILIGIAMLYTGITGLLNKTIIKIENGELTVNFEPLFWFGKKSIECSQITQLYTQESIVQSKGKSSKYYGLIALIKGNRSQKLLSYIESPEVVKCIEQQIESYLKIKNFHIQGEFEM